jgi:MFS family permease
MRRPWKNSTLGGHFWAIWSAGAVSYLGDGVTAGALPLLAAHLTSSPLKVSLVSTASSVGWLLLGLLSGAIVDRADRLAVMWQTNVIRGLVTVVLVVLIFTGSVTILLLLAISLALGLAAPFFDNAAASVIPELVPRSALESANAANQTSLLLLSGMIGPPLGAVLFVVAHGAPFSIDAASFLVAAALVARLARPGRQGRPGRPGRLARRSPGPAVASGPKPGIWASLREGASFLWGHSTLRSLALILAAINAATSGVAASLVLYVLDVLHLPRADFGWLLAGYALGGAIGSVLGVRCIRRWGQRGCCAATLLGTAAGVLAIGVLTSAAVVVIALSLAGFSVGLRNIVLVSYRQRAVERSMLGRVNSVYRVTIFVAISAGTVVIGALGSALGLRTAFTIAGVALVAIAVLSLPTIRRLPGRPQLSGAAGAS